MNAKWRTENWNAVREFFFLRMFSTKKLCVLKHKLQWKNVIKKRHIERNYHNYCINRDNLSHLITRAQQELLCLSYNPFFYQFASPLSSLGAVYPYPLFTIFFTFSSVILVTVTASFPPSKPSKPAMYIFLQASLSLLKGTSALLCFALHLRLSLFAVIKAVGESGQSG